MLILVGLPGPGRNGGKDPGPQRADQKPPLPLVSFELTSEDSQAFHTLYEFKFLFTHCVSDYKFTKSINALSYLPLQNQPAVGRDLLLLGFPSFLQIIQANP